MLSDSWEVMLLKHSKSKVCHHIQAQRLSAFMSVSAFTRFLRIHKDLFENGWADEDVGTLPERF